MYIQIVKIYTNMFKGKLKPGDFCYEDGDWFTKSTLNDKAATPKRVFLVSSNIKYRPQVVLLNLNK